MINQTKSITMVGDFETTVYDGQDSTEVWASALVELHTENVLILHSIDDTLDYLESLENNIILYYHNLKFDGSFWLSYLLTKTKYKQALITTESDGHKQYQFVEQKYLQNGTFTYCISDMGLWYDIIIKTFDGYTIEIRDSLKLLPFSVKKIGKSFGTKHKKLDMEYKGYRYAGCPITDEEKKYIANDVLVVKEALEIMFEQGHKKLTIGSCCFTEFKNIIGKKDYETFCPDLTAVPVPFGNYKNADEYIRHSYRGGWCYVAKGKEETVYQNGITLDVNSLYPSMMSRQSKNEYPTGLPFWWQGEIPPEAQQPHRYYFVHLRTRFYIKANKLPTIQIKGNPLYKGNEWLESSDVVDKNGVHHTKYIMAGEERTTRHELYLTMTDYKLLLDQYNLVDCEILDGCWFYTFDELFDQYIDKYKKIKMTSTGAIRELAKLFLNNLYGKLASGVDSWFKVAYIKENGALGFTIQEDYSKKAGYIAIGSAITSYARNFTIRTAQANYYGKDKRGFIYADTDSIHCNLSVDEIKGVTLHKSEFCCWKHESSWDYGYFTRQKTYIEHIVEEDGKQIEQPYLNIKCAGMPERCKQLLQYSMGDRWVMNDLTKDGTEELSPAEAEFCRTDRTVQDFGEGLIVPSKLMPKNIKGGIVLMDTNYEMRG